MSNSFASYLFDPILKSLLGQSSRPLHSFPIIIGTPACTVNIHMSGIKPNGASFNGIRYDSIQHPYAWAVKQTDVSANDTLQYNDTMFPATISKRSLGKPEALYLGQNYWQLRGTSLHKVQEVQGFISHLSALYLR